MRIALLGSAPSSVRLGPFRDASYEQFKGARPVLERAQFPFAGENWQIWACSPGVYGVAERVDRWFELHRWEPGQPWFSPEYCDFLRAFKGPVYTTEVIPEIPNSVRYPREMVVEVFSQYFMTSSLSFMLGLAIIEIEMARKADAEAGRDHNQADDVIGLWGVDMAATEEYGYQRAGCQYFMLEAARRNITVALPPESDLGRPMPMYGVSEWSHAHIKLLQRKRELDQRLAQVNAELENKKNESFFLRGAIDDLDYMTKTWALTDNSTLVGSTQGGAQLTYIAHRRQEAPAPAPEPAPAPDLSGGTRGGSMIDTMVQTR